MQKVSSYDISSITEIISWAENFNVDIHQGKLKSQFRCNGSDGYLSFLDDVLEIKHDYYTFDPEDYDIKIVDNPNEMIIVVLTSRVVYDSNYDTKVSAELREDY